ncbi:hypothetical protein D9Q98_009515 [Chlorella vulgaris]|uniref:SBP-type domain-containing protein n=1 Tax=Chlorella vulgaris TaxID=3077 RepID=A0A9D4TF95_CHLVU|nr:hypothetical protein D9Q98_009515 [Chlorella vulgaris]
MAEAAAAAAAQGALQGAQPCVGRREQPLKRTPRTPPGLLVAASGALFGGTAVYPLSKYAGMEGDYVNGTVEEQAAPQTLQELQAAGVHAMPVVAGFQEALAAQAAQLQAAAGTPAGMTGDDSTPGMHMGGSMSGRGRMSSGSFKNRSGPSYCQVEQCGEPLEGLKEYHQRYKVCEEHLKIPYIIRDGQQVRFCQQCGRFQPLEDFDDAKRSCRVRLQRHNARRRKKGPREGNSGGGMDHHHHMGDYGSMGGAAAEMAKLAYPQAAMVSGKDIQAMQEALHFASTTLMHSSQVTGKPAGEEGGEEGEGGGGVAMGPNSMPFVPQPDVMMLLLKGYAAMFHYALDSATLRGLAQPSDLPDQQAAAAAGGGMGLGAVDALQMQHLMQAQGFFAGAGMPMLLPSGEAVEGMLPEEGQEAGGEGQQQQEQQPGGAEEEQQQQLQEHGAGEQQQQEHAAAVAAAHAAAGGGELTAEQVAAALIQPMPQDAAAAEGAMAAAAALASAAGAHVPSSAGYGEAGGEQEDHAEAMQQ